MAQLIAELPAQLVKQALKVLHSALVYVEMDLELFLKIVMMEIKLMEMAEVILGLLRMDLLAQMIFFREVLVY